jgi:hypothetical protein
MSNCAEYAVVVGASMSGPHNAMVGYEPPCPRAEILKFLEEFAPSDVVAAVRVAEPIGEVTGTAPRPTGGGATTRCVAPPRVCSSSGTRSAASTLFMAKA